MYFAYSKGLGSIGRLGPRERVFSRVRTAPYGEPQSEAKRNSMTIALNDPQIWVSLLTLTALEIVLGIDNVIFISLVTERLRSERRARARQIGLVFALVIRLGLLAGATWIVGLTEPVFEAAGHAISWRDLLLLAGGLFLLVKGTTEIHHTIEGPKEFGASSAAVSMFVAVIVQIIVLDIVFSFDSIITAVGLTQELAVMYVAVAISMIVMLVAAAPVAAFIHAHQSVKMLALSFLILIGTALIADGLHFHIPKGYLYFAIAFSVGVEALNILAARRRKAENP